LDLSPSTGHKIVRDFGFPSRCQWDLPYFVDFTRSVESLEQSRTRSQSSFYPEDGGITCLRKVGTRCHTSAYQNKEFPAVPSRTSRRSETWYVIFGSSPALFPGLKPRPGRLYWQRGLRFSFVFRFTPLSWFHLCNFTNTVRLSQKILRLC
jgi:hypothetical protein